MNEVNAVEGQIQGGLKMSECQICAHLILGTSCDNVGWSHAVNTISASCGGMHACRRSLVGQRAVGVKAASAGGTLLDHGVVLIQARSYQYGKGDRVKHPKYDHRYLHILCGQKGVTFTT